MIERPDYYTEEQWQEYLRAKGPKPKEKKTSGNEQRERANGSVEKLSRAARAT